ncbi:hypothetical protein BCh11DRAFT_07768 [Burkholderia sp. Ch1-1]|nr:hypothetical protein BCh11DRAFT_07768 [Burkholderia sp. Ch1-1]
MAHRRLEHSRLFVFQRIDPAVQTGRFISILRGFASLHLGRS